MSWGWRSWAGLSTVWHPDTMIPSIVEPASLAALHARIDFGVGSACQETTSASVTRAPSRTVASWNPGLGCFVGSLVAVGIGQMLRRLLGGDARTTHPAPVKAVSPSSQRPAVTQVQARQLSSAQGPETVTNSLRTDEAADQPREATAAKKHTIEMADLRIVDLAELPSLRTRIKGSAYWVTDAERRRHGGNEYLLVRERDNEHDPNAVAVYGRGRKVGSLSTAKAAALVPSLDRLSADAYRVTGAGTNAQSIRLWVDLPRTPVLRGFAATQP